jgi:hypothetical protein
MSRFCRVLLCATAIGGVGSIAAFVAFGQQPNPAEGPVPPRIIKCEPAESSVDVPTDLEGITVTFDQPMADGSWSWMLLKAHGTYPGYQGGAPQFNADRTACTLPVRLEPNTIYAIGMNSFRHTGFRGEAGKPAVNYGLAFATQGDIAEDELPPRVVKCEPENGANDVDPVLREIKVTFDREMKREKSWSWVYQNASGAYPGYRGGPDPSFDETGKTCSLPVRLSPDTVYAVSINSYRHTGFKDLQDHPALPYGYTFKTR